jgi:hypothetical protein
MPPYATLRFDAAIAVFDAADARRATAPLRRHCLRDAMLTLLMLSPLLLPMLFSPFINLAFYERCRARGGVRRVMRVMQRRDGASGFADATLFTPLLRLICCCAAAAPLTRRQARQPRRWREGSETALQAMRVCAMA